MVFITIWENCLSFFPSIEHANSREQGASPVTEFDTSEVVTFQCSEIQQKLPQGSFPTKHHPLFGRRLNMQGFWGLAKANFVCAFQG